MASLELDVHDLIFAPDPPQQMSEVFNKREFRMIHQYFDNQDTNRIDPSIIEKSSIPIGVLGATVVDGEIVIAYPGESEYYKACGFDCCGFYKFKKLKHALFCNTWECKFLPFVYIVCFICDLIFSSISLLLYRERPQAYILFAFYIFFFINWAVSFFRAMCQLPGILPFNYKVNKKENYTFDEVMKGTSVTPHQDNYAHYNEVPERATYARSERRIVLRADHYCGWVGNFIGLKNTRFFIQQLFWGTLCVFVYYGIMIWSIVDYAKNGKKVPGIDIFNYVCSFPSLLPGGMIVFMFGQHIVLLSFNRTTLETFKGKGLRNNKYNIGCIPNWSSICGPVSEILCWPFGCLCLPYTNDGITYPTNDLETDLENIQDCHHCKHQHQHQMHV